MKLLPAIRCPIAREKALTCLSLFLLFTNPNSVLCVEIEKNPALSFQNLNSIGSFPSDLEYESYMKWLGPVLKNAEGNDISSPFTKKLFSWYQREKDSPLPKEVATDDKKIFASVEKPRAETELLEAQEKIALNTTIGAEVYAELDGTIEQALETMEFRWGKPLGATEGKTHPSAKPFKRRVEYFAPLERQSKGVNLNLGISRGGAFLDAITDRYLFLVKGSKETGYDIFMQFIGRGGKSATESCLAIALLRPIAEGKKTAFKLSTRYIGQNYNMFGSSSKDRIGFNPKKVREVQMEFNAALKELIDTGKITQTNDDIEFNTAD